MSVPVVSIFTSTDYEGQIQQAATLLRDGKLVVLPTETVYGAAGLLTHTSALESLKAIREESAAGPFTIHVPNAERAAEYLSDVGMLGARMMKKLWPGPVGLVFDVPAGRRAEVAARLGVAESEVYASDGTITLRCPDDTVARAVLEPIDGPVVLASIGSSTNPPANAAGELDDRVAMIVDAGPTRFHQPSTILKVSGETYKIVRKGVYDERIIERLLHTTILFVCSGNTCRSPMAEAITRHLLAEANGVNDLELDKKGISVISAGAYAMPGSRATPQGIDAVKSMGADLTSHRSRQLTPELIHQADMIYTMGRGHALAVTSMVPSAKVKVATLDPTGDIEDPIGGDAALYRDLAGELRKLIEQRLKERELLTSH